MRPSSHAPSRPDLTLRTCRPGQGGRPGPSGWPEFPPDVGQGGGAEVTLQDLLHPPRAGVQQQAPSVPCPPGSPEPLLSSRPEGRDPRPHPSPPRLVTGVDTHRAGTINGPGPSAHKYGEMRGAHGWLQRPRAVSVQPAARAGCVTAPPALCPGCRGGSSPRSPTADAARIAADRPWRPVRARAARPAPASRVRGRRRPRPAVDGSPRGRPLLLGTFIKRGLRSPRSRPRWCGTEAGGRCASAQCHGDMTVP